MAKDDDFCDRAGRAREAIGDKMFPRHDKRRVGDEIRYYCGDSYAVISRMDHCPRWFMVLPGGDVAIRNKAAK